VEGDVGPAPPVAAQGGGDDCRSPATGRLVTPGPGRSGCGGGVGLATGGALNRQQQLNLSAPLLARLWQLLSSFMFFCAFWHRFLVSGFVPSSLGRRVYSIAPCMDHRRAMQHGYICVLTAFVLDVTSCEDCGSVVTSHRSAEV